MGLSIMGRAVDGKRPNCHDNRIVNNLLNYLSLGLFVFALFGAATFVFFIFNNDKVELPYFVEKIEHEIQQWNDGQRKHSYDFRKQAN